MTNRGEFHKQAGVAAILNAGWHVRNNRRGSTRHSQALTLFRETVREYLDTPNPEPMLYAVALALYDRHDPRFHV